VLDRLLAEAALHGTRLAGARQVVTTLFADVRGFTTMSERLPPEDLFALLNEHLNLAAQAVLDHEGTIDKFLGDAVMALYNVPDPQPDHALRAVRTALDMQRRLAAHRRGQSHSAEIHFGAAISTGEAIVGNVGTAELFNYTAIGDVVNLAKRLQERAAPGQILLSEAVYWAVRDEIETRPLEPLQVKGRAAFEQVYAVVMPV
jgi:class 3 adenylate cyclase